jgi:hypothetical protein
MLKWLHTQFLSTNRVSPIPQSAARSVITVRGETDQEHPINEAGNQDKDGFVTPKYHIKKSKNIIMGNGGASGNFRGAPEPSRDLFVFRTGKSTTEEDIKMHLLQKGTEVRDIKLVSHADSKFNSFKVTVCVSEVKRLMDAKNWPNGVGIRMYRTARKKEEI